MADKQLVAYSEDCEKAANLYCGLREDCGDNNDMWEDETLEKYKEFIECNACLSDEDEEGYLYHPKCYETKHKHLSSKKKANHMASRKVWKTVDLKKLSSEERVMTLKEKKKEEKGEILLKAFSTYYPSLPNAVTGVTSTAIALGKGLTNYGAAYVLDDIVTVHSNLSQGASFGLGVGLAGVTLVTEVGYQAVRWHKGTITSDEFKMKGIQAVLGTLSSTAFATIGTLIGTAVFPGLGTIIGGVIGAIVGGYAGYKVRAAVESFFDYAEDSKRADLIIEAFNFLDLPALHLINDKVVEQSFRKKALECHPDSVRVKNRNDIERSIAEVQWGLLQHAKDVALGYFQYKHGFSPRCKDTIKKKYDPENRGTTQFDELKESLDKSSKSGGIIV